jgi:hypothetical protein
LYVSALARLVRRGSKSSLVGGGAQHLMMNAKKNAFMLNHPFHDDNYLRGGKEEKPSTTARCKREKFNLSVSMFSVSRLPRQQERLLRYSAEVRSILLSLSQLVDVTIESRKSKQF